MTFTFGVLTALAAPTFVWGKGDLAVLVAIGALSQTYHAVQKVSHSRQIFLIVLFCLLTGLTFRHMNLSSLQLPHSLFGNEEPHPIEVLVTKAQDDFSALLSRQSTTVDAAIAEYQRRYDRVPPPGFDEWVKLAHEANCSIIDDFDVMMQNLEPFWGISAQEMRARATMLDNDPMMMMHVNNHSVTISRDTLVLGYFNEIILEWTTRYQHLLPDLTFVVNGLAEPRVIVPNDRLEHDLRTCAPSPTNMTSGTRKELEIMDLSKESSWQIGMRSCPESSPSRALVIPEEDTAIKFVQNATEAKDWCLHPRAGTRHAMFSSPFNLKITNSLIPVFSHGKPSTSQDILYPSPDYVGGYRSGRYDEKKDGAWENKTNKLYWSGSDTGGYAYGKEWHQFHRQRFVESLTNGDSDVALLRRNETGQWEEYIDKMANLANLADVKFSALGACSGSACSDEEKHLPVGDRDELAKIHDYRYLFDVDGMGRTERYYRLLGSRSTVFKQTMHQEWHDDRLIPWAHYVPVSLSMSELPETMRFLMQTEKGQKISKSIADQGRQWQQTALREKDMELAFLRTMLEYGRLYSEDRDLSGYCPGGRTKPEG